MEVVLVYAALGTITALCFLAGLARARYRRAPLLAVIAIVATYVIFVFSMWVWASRCWSCGGDSDGEFVRRMALAAAIFWAGLVALIDIAVIWIGAWLSGLIWESQPLIRRDLVPRTLAIAGFLIVFAVVFLMFG